MIYTKQECNDAYKLLQNILRNEKCLVIEDGMDEWVDKNGQVAYPIMLECQHKWTVFITTRPNKLADERIRNSDIGILLELDGVKQPFLLSFKILRFFEKTLLYIKNQKFKQYINNNSLDEVVLSPMMLGLCVCLWKDETYLKGSDCDIYATILDSLAKKVLNIVDYFKEPPCRCFSKTKYIKRHIEDVNALATAAFYLLFSHKKEATLVFSESDLLNFISDEQKRFALKAGILSERKRFSQTYTHSMYSFIYKSVQEFLAAYHIARHETVITDQISNYLNRYSNAYTDLSHVFTFLCGMNIRAGEQLSCLIDEHCHTPAPIALQAILVAGYKEAVANAVVDCNIRLSHFHFVDLADTDDDVLVRILMSNTYNVCSLSVFGIISLKMLYRLTTICVLSAQVISHLTINVDLDCEDVHIVDLSLCHNLESISIKGNMSLMPNMLCELTRLKNLDLYCNCELLDISMCHSLETVSLGERVTLTSNPLCELTSLNKVTIHDNCDVVDLSSCSNLETVEIKGNLSLLLNCRSGFQKLKHIILACTCKELDLSACYSLEKVSLRGNVTLVPNALLLNQMQELKHLKYLMLCCNTCSDMLDLSSCTSLENALINGNVTLVSNTFTGCSNLQRLKLLCNCSTLDLSSCVNLETIYINGKVNLFPNSLRNLCKLKRLKLICNCDQLDLIDCTALETLDLRRDITLPPTTMRALRNILRIKLMCKCDGLDLSSCSMLETIFIKGEVSLLPHALNNLNHLRKLTLNCKCDELSLSSCYSLTLIDVSGEVKMGWSTALDLSKLKNLSLRCRCDMLDLAPSPNLEALDLSGKVNLVAGSIVNQQHLKHLSLRCNCDELILPLGSMKIIFTHFHTRKNAPSVKS